MHRLLSRSLMTAVLAAACISGLLAPCLSAEPAIAGESELDCQVFRRHERERITVVFNVSSILDPNITFAGFLIDNRTGRSVVTPLPITFPTGSGSLSPLVLTVSPSRTSVTFGVKIFSALGTITSGEVRAAVTTRYGTTIYDLNPSSGAVITDPGAQAAVLEYTLPVGLL